MALHVKGLPVRHSAPATSVGTSVDIRSDDADHTLQMLNLYPPGITVRILDEESEHFVQIVLIDTKTENLSFSLLDNSSSNVFARPLCHLVRCSCPAHFQLRKCLPVCSKRPGKLSESRGHREWQGVLS